MIEGLSLDEAFIQKLHQSPDSIDDEPFILYPNATDGLINIQDLEYNLDPNFEIHDMQNILKMSGTMKDNTINVSRLATGLYVLKLQTENGTLYKKFIRK